MRSLDYYAEWLERYIKKYSIKIDDENKKIIVRDPIEPARKVVLDRLLYIVGYRGYNLIVRT